MLAACFAEGEFPHISMNLSKGWQKAIKTAKMQDILQKVSFRAVQLCKKKRGGKRGLSGLQTHSVTANIRNTEVFGNLPESDLPVLVILLALTIFYNSGENFCILKVKVLDIAIFMVYLVKQDCSE